MGALLPLDVPPKFLSELILPPLASTGKLNFEFERWHDPPNGVDISDKPEKGRIWLRKEGVRR